jgi:hypothetical protein
LLQSLKSEANKGGEMAVEVAKPNGRRCREFVALLDKLAGSDGKWREKAFAVREERAGAVLRAKETRPGRACGEARAERSQGNEELHDLDVRWLLNMEERSTKISDRIRIRGGPN